MKWTIIAASLGYSLHALRRALDPGYRERRQAQGKECKRRQREGSGRQQRVRVDGLYDMRTAGGSRDHAIDDRELRQRRREIPIDTRPLTARMMDDPLPGRSALDRKEAMTWPK